MASDWEGAEVTEEHAAAFLGFRDVADLRAWKRDGSPSGRCSNAYCWRPASWPHLYEPCKHCGGMIQVTLMG